MMIKKNKQKMKKISILIYSLIIPALLWIIMSTSWLKDVPANCYIGYVCVFIAGIFLTTTIDFFWKFLITTFSLLLWIEILDPWTLEPCIIAGGLLVIGMMITLIYRSDIDHIMVNILIGEICGGCIGIAIGLLWFIIRWILCMFGHFSPPYRMTSTLDVLIFLEGWTIPISVLVCGIINGSNKKGLGMMKPKRKKWRNLYVKTISL